MQSIESTFNDLEWPRTRISKSRHFLKSNIGKRQSFYCTRGNYT